MIQARRRPFRGVTLAPKGAVNDVAEPGLLRAVNDLLEQSNLAYRLSRLFGYRQPVPIAGAPVAFLMPPDPILGFFPRVALRPIAHHLRMGQHGGDKVEVG